jgi:Family of unknown function (DUF6353)
MNYKHLVGLIKSGLRVHSPLIFSAVAGAGTLATAYLAGKASFKAAKVISAYEHEEGRPVDRKERIKVRTKLVWRFYIPTGISAVSTIACIFGANRTGYKKTLAAQAAFALSQQKYSEYRAKVVEELGSRKDQSIRDKVAEDKIAANPPTPGMFATGPGRVLCCELYTGRYFVSDFESLRRAVNSLNASMLQQDYATLEDLYYLLELRNTSNSSRMGWRSEKLLEFEFTTVMSPEDVPCIAFDYNYIMAL